MKNHHSPLLSLSSMLLITTILLGQGCTLAPRDDNQVNPQYQIQYNERTGELQLQAENAAKVKDFNRAELLLERAIRIEPRNGNLWYSLAKVNLAQDKYDLAVQCSRKSNSLAGNLSALYIANQKLIELAHKRMK